VAAAAGRFTTIIRQEAQLALAADEYTGDVRNQRLEVKRQKEPARMGSGRWSFHGVRLRPPVKPGGRGLEGRIPGGLG
jgi:hypothetical protein